MNATRLALALLLLVGGFAACDRGAVTAPEPATPALRDGSGLYGSGNNSDSTTTTSSDSTSTGSG